MQERLRRSEESGMMNKGLDEAIAVFVYGTPMQKIF